MNKNVSTLEAGRVLASATTRRRRTCAARTPRRRPRRRARPSRLVNRRSQPRCHQLAAGHSTAFFFFFFIFLIFIFARGATRVCAPRNTLRSRFARFHSISRRRPLMCVATLPTECSRCYERGRYECRYGHGYPPANHHFHLGHPLPETTTYEGKFTDEPACLKQQQSVETLTHGPTPGCGRLRKRLHACTPAPTPCERSVQWVGQSAVTRPAPRVATLGVVFGAHVHIHAPTLALFFFLTYEAQVPYWFCRRQLAP